MNLISSHFPDVSFCTLIEESRLVDINILLWWSKIIPEISLVCPMFSVYTFPLCLSYVTIFPRVSPNINFLWFGYIFKKEISASSLLTLASIFFIFPVKISRILTSLLVAITSSSCASLNWTATGVIFSISTPLVLTIRGSSNSNQCNLISAPQIFLSLTYKNDFMLPLDSK